VAQALSRTEGFAEFFDENYAKVLGALRLVISDRGQAEDRAQEGFLRAYRQWSRIRSMDRPVTWVYVVALNAERRRWKRRIDTNEQGPEIAVPDIAGSVVTIVTIRDALDCLTERQRTMVVLRFFSELQIAEIARVMGCADGTVKATLHQSLARLRLEVEGEFDEN
jgi:RNA polymerase sigma-70 factor (sigma-E family)